VGRGAHRLEAINGLYSDDDTGKHRKEYENNRSKGKTITVHVFRPNQRQVDAVTTPRSRLNLA
jgi:hypothetical protein